MSHDKDPYRGLPGLARLESDLERSERHLNKGFASRHMRLIAGAGAVLAVGFAVSPVGPALGENESLEGTVIVPCPTFERSVEIEPGTDVPRVLSGTSCDSLVPVDRPDSPLVEPPSGPRGAPAGSVTPQAVEPPGAPGG